MLRRGVLPAAVRPVCLDLRPASLAEVDQPHRVCASVLSLPFAARSFDTVTCLEVLEHLDDPAAAVRELARVARRAVVVSVPFEPYFRIGNVLRGKHLSPSGQSPRACATLESPHLSRLPLGLGGRGADRRSVSLDHRVLPSRPTLIFLLLAVIGVARIAATYRSIAQTSDETPNIACGMQYLDLGRYDYGAFHPPWPASRWPSALTSTARARRSCPTAGTKATPSSTAPRATARRSRWRGSASFRFSCWPAPWSGYGAANCSAIGARWRRSSSSPTCRRCWRTPAWPPWIWRSAPASAPRSSPTRCGWKMAACAAPSSSASAWRWRSSPNSPPCCCCRSASRPSRCCIRGRARSATGRGSRSPSSSSGAPTASPSGP